jgi:hypothetical protein
MFWMFQIKILVNVQNINHDSLICETRVTLQIHHAAFFFIVAPCISKIHLSSHTNKCTNIIYYLKSGLIQAH